MLTGRRIANSTCAIAVLQTFESERIFAFENAPTHSGINTPAIRLAAATKFPPRKIMPGPVQNSCWFRPPAEYPPISAVSVGTLLKFCAMHINCSVANRDSYVKFIKTFVFPIFRLEADSFQVYIALQHNLVVQANCVFFFLGRFLPIKLRPFFGAAFFLCISSGCWFAGLTRQTSAAMLQHSIKPASRQVRTYRLRRAPGSSEPCPPTCQA